MTEYTGQYEQFNDIDELAYKYFCILAESEGFDLNSLEVSQINNANLSKLESLEEKCLKLAMYDKGLYNHSKDNKKLWDERKDNRFTSYRHQCSPARDIINQHPPK